jgi:hypothetical protein
VTDTPHLAADHIRDLIRGYTTTDRIDRFVPIPNVGDTPTWTRTRVLHTVTHQPLLDQLEEAVQQAKDSGDYAGGAAKSKPAARLDAIATLQRIDKQSKAVARELGLDPAPLRARLSAISGKIGSNPHPTVRKWWVAARCATGWETAPYSPDVPCPNIECERWSSVRIRLDQYLAHCVECGETWDESNFTQLGDYVRWASEHLRGPRHWKYDADGFPVECVECLVERQVMAERKAARQARVA